MSTNKMAEIVDSEAAPVDTFVPEARLDDNGRRKLIAFYKEKPILWDEKVSPVAKYRKVKASLSPGLIAALIIVSCLCIWMLIRPTKSLNFSLSMRKYRAKAGASSTANSLIS